MFVSKSNHNAEQPFASVPPGYLQTFEEIIKEMVYYSNELLLLCNQLLAFNNKFSQFIRTVRQKCREADQLSYKRSFENEDLSFLRDLNFKDSDGVFASVNEVRNLANEIGEKISEIINEITICRNKVKEIRARHMHLHYVVLNNMLDNITAFLDFLWRLEIDRNDTKISRFWKGNNEPYNNLLKNYHDLIAKLIQFGKNSSAG